MSRSPIGRAGEGGGVGGAGVGFKPSLAHTTRTSSTFRDRPPCNATASGVSNGETHGSTRRPPRMYSEISSGVFEGLEFMSSATGPAAAPPAPAPEPAAEPAPAAAPKWTVGEVNKMTVPKLKAALTELGLDTSGLKAVLKARLLEAL